MARKAKATATLQAQLDAKWPGRKKPDGWIGDTAHAARKSDHNPNSSDVVQALDVSDNKDGKGPRARALAEALLASRDQRIKYVISNRQIAASYATGGAMPWAWRPYTGANAHEQHMHLSVSDSPSLYDDARPWTLPGLLDSAGPAVPPVPLPLPDATGFRKRMGELIVSYEQKPPYRVITVTDGSREIAGVNERSHPEKFARMAALVGNDSKIAAEVAAYYVEYSNLVSSWTNDAQVEFYLRDCVVNRGPTGAAKILQMAVDVEVDGAVGPETKKATARASGLLIKLRAAREAYERKMLWRAGDHRYRDEAWPLWKGMTNRWNKALADARTFPTAAQPPIDAGSGAGGAIIIGGGAAAGGLAAADFHWSIAVGVLVASAIFAAVVITLVKKRR